MTATAASTKSNTMPSGSNRLPELAARANKEHGKAVASSRRTVQHVIAAGEALDEAKRLVGHGAWLKWLKAQCPKISEQTARVYKQVWRGRDQIANAGDLTLRAALKVLAKKLPEPEPELSLDEPQSDANDDGESTSSISLDEWKELSGDERREFLQPHNFPGLARFNSQGDKAGIEWAQWSWNPVTGCLHDCPYCYARDIATRFTNAYPFAFAPAFRPDALNAPGKTLVPAEAEYDTRYRNVFTCSMADLFGRWVPREWIVAVLDTVRDNPQWNFLFLTKFPKRMAEFEIPGNAWMGTTVDLQARVPNAEAAFERLKNHAGVRWLSIEPMIEPLRFTKLGLFHWIVIGGASASTQTPEWRPPLRWITDLCAQADAVGAHVYFKTNLLGNRRLELPFAAPIKGDPIEAPIVFHYLGKQTVEP